MKTFAVILAAGKGKRFTESCHSEPEGPRPVRRKISPVKKQFLLLDGEPLWLKSLYPFQNLPFITGIVVVLPPEEIEGESRHLLLEGTGGARRGAAPLEEGGGCPPRDRTRPLLSESRWRKITAILSGGDRRQDSVYAALSWIAEHHRADFVFIHDGVRPFVTADLIERLWEERESGAVIPVIPISDTVKRISFDEVIETLDRSSLVRVQTPQLFSFPLIMEAFQELQRNPVEVTDDASVVERIGKPVKVIEGEIENIKITTVRDLDSSRYALLGVALGMTNVGQGIDIHPFEVGRKLILGGVEIPYEKGLRGHSDADVLTHAICDAILGGAGLPDLGTHFPDSDPAYKDSSSLILLQNVVDKVRANHYSIMHIDSTIMAEKPKISPFVDKMKESLCAILNISPEQLAIKAKTGEGIGFIGREEGIVALAIATLQRKAENEADGHF